MGVDLLDIVFRLEKAFSIHIDRDDLVPYDILDDTQGKYVIKGELTTLGLEEIKRRIPSADLASFEKKPMVQNLATILTVGTLCGIVENKIRAKNNGIDTFPNISLQVSHSVPKTLAKCFNIADSSRIVQEMRLEQLAGLSPLPKNFWRQFYKRFKDDSDELKAIKVCVRSCELVSAWDTSFWSFFVTFVSCLWFWLGVVFDFFHFDVLPFLTVLFIPSLVLFGSRFVMNWKRCGQASRVTVGEIIDALVEQRPDHSVRADGLPYNRKEIEQIVAEILCEALAVKPEEVRPEARIIHDLGAA